MKFLKWLFGPDMKGKNERYETMPDFKGIFDSMPNIVNPTQIQPNDSNRKKVATAQERDAARNLAENTEKATISKDKVKEVYIRIQTAMSRHKEIVWLLRADKDTSHKCLKDLLKSYRNMKDMNSYKGMSVNYESEGKLHEISSLDEQDVEGLEQKLDSEKQAGAKASPTGR